MKKHISNQFSGRSTAADFSVRSREYTMKNKINYSIQSQITNPGKYRRCFDNLPSNISELCQIVQGVMLHIHWADRYGIAVTKERQHEEGLRKVNRQLALITERTSSTFSLPRSQRIFGTCRDFSTMLCSILRHQNIPSRPRCGFATYFGPKKCDHWVCEYWDPILNKWRLVDAQLDDLQIKNLGVDFDTTDIPKGKFLVAGEAWQQCQNGADSNDFGIMNWFGLWFVKGNLIRDLLSLSKLELLPWDTNEAIGPYKNQKIKLEEYSLLDIASQITIEGDYLKVKDFLKKNKELCMCTEWTP